MGKEENRKKHSGGGTVGIDALLPLTTNLLKLGYLLQTFFQAFDPGESLLDRVGTQRQCSPRKRDVEICLALVLYHGHLPQVDGGAKILFVTTEVVEVKVDGGEPTLLPLTAQHRLGGLLSQHTFQVDWLHLR